MPGTITVNDFFRQKFSYKVAEGSQREQLPIVSCQECGHGFTPLTVSEEEILAWYAEAGIDQPFLAGSMGRRKTARAVLARIEKLLPERGRLIDVGSGRGFFLDEARRRGWEAQGVEVAGWAVTFAREKLGLPITQGSFRELFTLSQGSVDVVTSFDVIEHVVSPHDFLKAAAGVLKPGGLLVLTTPWFDSLLARAMGRRWYCIFPAHLHYFTRRSLTKALAAGGFRLVRVRRHTRYLGAGYVWSRLRHHLGWAETQGTEPSERGVIPINFGDEFEVYAQKI